MNLKQFADLVSEMRQAQRDYLDTKNIMVARAMVEAEQKVDAALAEIYRETTSA